MCFGLQAFLRLRGWFDDLAGWRSSVERHSSRWRPAASLSKTAHRSESLRTRLIWRLPAAFEGRLNSKAGPPAGSTARGGCGRAQKRRSATVRLCFPRSARGCASLWGGGRCLWLRSVLGSLPRQRLKEADRSGGIKPDHTCWPPETLGLTPPARSAWLRPREAARHPEHNTIHGEKDPPNDVLGRCRTAPVITYV